MKQQSALVMQAMSLQNISTLLGLVLGAIAGGTIGSQFGFAAGYAYGVARAAACCCWSRRALRLPCGSPQRRHNQRAVR